MTYEGADAIRGPFLKTLGATAFQVGFISGLGEMLAASLRLFSGRLADRTHAYWAIAILGYSMNVIAIPALAFASTWQVATLLVVLERTGKAIRGPARDVLLSEATEHVGHGTGFGLHAAMDQIGAVVGPLLMAVALTRVSRLRARRFSCSAFPRCSRCRRLCWPGRSGTCRKRRRSRSRRSR